MSERHVNQQQYTPDGEATAERDRRAIDDYSAKASAAWQKITRYRLSDMHSYRWQAMDLREHARRSRYPQIRDRLFAIAETYERLAEAIEQVARFMPWRVCLRRPRPGYRATQPT